MSGRYSPTPENHRANHVPNVDWKENHDWDWPYREGGYTDPDVLFTSLHEEFNTIKIAIQDPHIWHADVCELVRKSANQAEFLTALRQRRDERYKATYASWVSVKCQMCASTEPWAHMKDPKIEGELWASFCTFARNFSFDTVLGHFGIYVPPREPYSDIDSDWDIDLEIELAEARDAAAAAARQIQQPTKKPTPDPSPPRRVTRAIEASKKPANRNRVEKQRAKRSTAKSTPPEGVRRSARLKEKAAAARRNK